MYKNLSILLFVLLLISSCKNDRIELEWTEMEIPSSFPLTDIEFMDDNTGFISTGQEWNGGEIWTTTDGGMNWEKTTNGDFQISEIGKNNNNEFFAIGFSGQFYENNPNDATWVQEQLNTYHAFTDFSSYDEEYMLFVAGGNFDTGFIAKRDVFGQIISVDSFEHDLEAITHIDAHHAIASGYGRIIRTDDSGANWYPVDVQGDYFKDIQFPSVHIGYSCGYSGSIIKSSDGGYTWDFLRDGDKILVKDKRFQALHFRDEDYGFIVGDDGLCWKTENGGADWSVVRNLPRYDYREVFIQGNRIFLVSREGMLVIIEE